MRNRPSISDVVPDFVGLILKHGWWKTGIGIIIGLVAAGLLSRFVTSMLFDTKPTDPMAYVVVSFVLLGVGVLASYPPARPPRASIR